MVKENIDNIMRLRYLIEFSLGKEIATPKEFDFLREEIFIRTHQFISTTTLKRLWGYINENTSPRKSTLDILSNYIGFRNWEDFCRNCDKFNLDHQEFLLHAKLCISSRIPTGTLIKVSWFPNSEMLLEHLDDSRFRIISSRNSNLPDNTITNMYLMIEGQPLALILDPTLAQNNIYIIGRSGGITFDINP